MANINGTNGNDAILGTPQDDLIRLFAGDDLANGLAGDDWLRGMNGDDTLFGGEGDDTLGGALGDDLHIDLAGENSTVYASKGNDRVIVELSAEDDQPGLTSTSARLYGDDGNDTIDVNLAAKNTFGLTLGDSGSARGVTSIRGGAGDDIVSAETTVESVYGGSSAITVFGDDGNDTITLNSFEDADYGSYGTSSIRAYGDTGDDNIIASAFATGEVVNELEGGAGKDTLDAGAFGGEFASNRLNGGSGDDILQAVAVSLFGGVYLGSSNELYGGDGDDVLEATSFSEFDGSVLRGGAGDDSLTAFLGIGNELDGGTGDDTLTGGFTATITESEPNDSFAERNVLIGGAVDNKVLALEGSLSAGGGDVDYFTISGLTPSSDIGITVNQPEFDLVWGLFDEAGRSVVETSDINFLRLSSPIPASGNVNIAVTAADDSAFSGDHEQEGNYVLKFSSIPAPTTSDTFVLRAGDGTDTVTNFEDATDSFGLADDLEFTQLSLSDDAGSAVISAGDEDLAIVVGVESASLTEDDFVLLS